ncbi:MAG: hypothetical protein ACRDQ7_13595 [Haloechinothrix sp.]
MTEQHPAEDLLIELALDDVARPQRDEVMSHISGCEQCRSSYDTIAGTIDRMLPAAPRTEPRPGFDGIVVAALGLEAGEHADLQRRRSARRKRRVLQLAAAAIIGIVLGAGATILTTGLSLFSGQESVLALTANSALLRTGDGETVGTVATSMVDGQPVVVVGVSRALVGVDYRCRLLLADGRRVDAGTWTARTEDGWTWVVRAPENDVVGLELVTSAGKVWSSAKLTAG